MSSATFTTAAVPIATATVAAVRETASNVAQKAPIERLLPLLATALTLVSPVLALPLRFLGFIPYFLTPLFYIFAPLTVTLRILYSLFVATPLAMATYALNTLFPVYVFCGVACLCAGVVGYAGRSFSKLLVRVIDG